MQGVNLHGVIVIVLGLHMGRRMKTYYGAAWGEYFGWKLFFFKHKRNLF